MTGATSRGVTTGAAVVAGVAGSPVRHSLSPVIHNAWIAAAGLDAAYVPVPVAADGFARLVAGLRGGVLRGLNVTVPFKAEALALADRADAAARAAGAANLLLFEADGSVEARNTDGEGLLGALSEQAPAWRRPAGPVVVLGAGGAARGAAVVLAGAGPELRIVNRTRAHADALADAFGARAYGWGGLEAALDGAALVVNATTRGLEGADPLAPPWPRPPQGAAAMDMVYRPLRTAFLRSAAEAGWATVDGLAMLVAQARPSFTAFYGRPPPPGTDVRALCLDALEPSA